MIERIVRFSLNNKLIIGILTLVLIAWGAYNFTTLSIDAVPDITNNQVQIVTVSPSLAPQEVEQLITFPVEMSMANLQDVTEIRSISRFGLSVVTIVFEDRLDPYLARQLVSEQITIAEGEIPEGLGNPEMMPVTTGLGEIYQYVIEPDPGYEGKYSPLELRTIQDWIIKRQLSGIPGIVEVSSFGGYMKQYEVSVNPRTLVGMDLSIIEIFDALEANNQNSGGSYIEKGPNAYYIRAEGLIRNEEDIGNILIKNIEGVPILIKDVAEIKMGWATRFGAMTRNGEGEAVGGITLMLKGANSAEVIQNVKDRVEQVQNTLPEGLHIHPYLDRSELINRTIRTVTTNLVEGGIIVILVLILLVGNLRASLIVASVIPLSMLFAFSMMNLFGVSANLMSLGAIDFGLIVDGSVIVTEGILSRLEHRYRGRRIEHSVMNGTVLNAAGNVGRSAVFGVTIILIVYIPILFFTGIEGKMFKPMAQTVSFALLGALILSLTYVPVAASLFLSRKITSGTSFADKIIGFLNRAHAPVLDFALKSRNFFLGLTLVIIAVSFWVFSRMGGEFIPTLEEGDLAAQMALSPGSSLSESIESATEAEKILLDQFPEVVEVVSKIGTAEVPTDPMAVEDADIMIILKDKKEWTTADNREDLVEKMKEALEVLPGLSFEFQQPIQLRFNELMTGVKSDVAVKIYGEDLNLLYDKAYEAAAIIQDVEGAGDVRVEQIVGLPQLVVRYDREAMARYGLNIDDVNKVIRSAFAGESAGVVIEGERRFDLVVRLKEDYRQRIKSLYNLRINRPSEELILLKQVADISYEKGPMQISRDDTKRRVTIGVNIRDRDVESFVEEINSKLEEQVILPAGYYFTYGGQFENLQNARRSSSIAVPIALIAIFVLLYFAFYSLKQAAMIFTAIPLAAVGGIWALYLRDMPFSISAGVGFIALFGVAVLNGIVLIAQYNDLEKEGVKDVVKRVKDGTRIRLRPVVMTASVAALGFLPMATSTAPGAEVQRPLATVVIGGLITATFLTLVVLPVIYVLFYRGFGRKGRKVTRFSAVLVLLLAGSANLNAQEPKKVGLDEMIDIALENNSLVTNADLKVFEAKMEKRAAVNIPNPEAEYTRGEINSPLIDYYLYFSQDLEFPTAYTSRSNYHSELMKLSEIEAHNMKLMVKGMVKKTYYRWMMLKQKQELMHFIDSLHGNFERIAEIRYETGDINYVSKLLTSSKAVKIRLEVEKLNAEVATAEDDLKTILNSDELLAFKESDDIKLNPPLFREEEWLMESPSIRSSLQEIEITEALIRARRNEALPGLRFGYFRQSLDLTGGFQGWLVGLKVPLWFWQYDGNIKAARIRNDMARNSFDQEVNRVKNRVAQLRREMRMNLEMISYYEREALELADIMMEQAQKSFAEGEIGLIEYIENISDAIDIKMEYYDALKDYNHAVIDLETIISEKNKID